MPAVLRDSVVPLNTLSKTRFPSGHVDSTRIEDSDPVRDKDTSQDFKSSAKDSDTTMELHYRVKDNDKGRPEHSYQEPFGLKFTPTAITTPVAIYQQRAVGRMMELTPVLQAWLQTLKTSVGVDHKIKGRDYATFNSEIQNAYRAKVKELYSANRCNPRVSFMLPWVQIPLFIITSLTIRGMAGYPLPFLGNSSLPVEPGFATGGTMWFTDLAAADPTWIMPIAVGTTNLLNVELNGMMMSKTPTRNQVIFRNVFRALSISMIPIAHEAPMAICLYWLSSGSYSVFQNIAFRVPTVRQWLKLPPLPKRESEKIEK
ncbi:Cytochrome c oxidase assembly protein cox18, mitochondrial [Mortierella sp. GBA35]|nr:Cytochrome c oxidase assembly protein cox18, mitochondrial [Mortierella sp. GBA35]